MATIIKYSELVTRAAEYICSKLAESPQKDIHGLVDEAAMRYNLSPQDSESLLRILAEKTCEQEKVS